MIRPLAVAVAITLPFATPALAQDPAGHHAGHHAGAETPEMAAHHRLMAAAANPNRKADAARDVHRHPVQTIEFFGIKPDMKVGEYAPGGGWYSRLLGNYMAPEGRLVGLYFTPEDGVFDEKARAGIREAAAGFPAKVQEWTGRPAAGTQGLALDAVSDADKGTFDRIIVVRMMHNMMRWGFADTEIKAMRDLLKPGGMLGVVQHRARADAPADYANGTKGYLRQDDVIGFVEAMGFELVGMSEVNANPKDPANHAGGVWEMKPTWSTKRAELENAGESDRMTLLFRKR